jgi:hypothetical protein
VQGVKIGDAIEAEQNGLAVDDALLAPFLALAAASTMHR